MSDVVRLVAGTAQWGQLYGIANSGIAPSVNQVSSMLEAAFEAGVRKLDTARAYGRSEELIGEVLRGDERWQIFTKLDPAVGALERGLSPVEQAEQSIEASMRALRRDRLDGLLLHRASQRVMAEGSLWDYLLSLKTQGLIGAMGVSAADPAEAWEALEPNDVDAVQVATSLFDRRLLGSGFFEKASTLEKRVFVRSVYLQGLAWLDETRLPARFEPLREALGGLSSWARERGSTLGQVCLRFVLSAVETEVVVGCETPEQMRRNLSTVQEHRRFSSADLDELEALAGSWDVTVLDPRSWTSTSS